LWAAFTDLGLRLIPAEFGNILLAPFDPEGREWRGSGGEMCVDKMRCGGKFLSHVSR
jgi:hypothetical protein